MNTNQELYDMVYGWKTKYKEGFMPDELKEITDQFPQMDMDKYEDAMMGNTCSVHEGRFCMYHTDVYKAIRCGLEKRDLKVGEWD